MTTTRASTPEPASFRDPEARVVYSPDGDVLRELSPRASEDWAALERARFFRRALEDGRVVATEEIEPGLLQHERLPFVSYPYEWPFEMLKDAALLQLGLLQRTPRGRVVTPAGYAHLGLPAPERDPRLF